MEVLKERLVLLEIGGRRSSGNPLGGYEGTPRCFWLKP